MKNQIIGPRTAETHCLLNRLPIKDSGINKPDTSSRRSHDLELMVNFILSETKSSRDFPPIFAVYALVQAYLTQNLNH